VEGMVLLLNYREDGTTRTWAIGLLLYASNSLMYISLLYSLEGWVERSQIVNQPDVVVYMFSLGRVRRG
jgi:hypothetical protein